MSGRGGGVSAGGAGVGAIAGMGAHVCRQAVGLCQWCAFLQTGRCAPRSKEGTRKHAQLLGSRGKGRTTLMDAATAAGKGCGTRNEQGSAKGEEGGSLCGFARHRHG